MIQPLTIGKDGFALPLDFVTKTQAILARKRSGKSYTAQKQAEQLLEHGQQIAALDPTGAWWGLRSSADGSSEGYPVVVFGGEHADAPLDPLSGAAMANALVEHGFSAIYDLGEMTADNQVIFAAAFCSELYRLNRKAMHLFLDEADVFAPQKTMGQKEDKCLHAVKRLVKMGGIRGIGCTMITQRPAVLNKDVLTQVDIITAMRMSHPQDIKPVYDWLASEVDASFAGKVRDALPSLPTGTAYIASSLMGIAQRVEIAQKTTFNSGATPKPGETRVEPKVLAGIDVVKLGEEIAASVQRAKEESPEYLKQRIRELEAEAAKGGKVDMGFIEEAQAAQAELEKLREDRVGLIYRANHAEGRVRTYDAAIGRVLDAVMELHKLQTEEVDPDDVSAIEIPSPPLVRATATTDGMAAARPPAVYSSQAEVRYKVSMRHAEGITTAEQKVLDALARLEACGVSSPSKNQLAAFAGYSNPKSGGFSMPMAALVKKGYATSNNGCSSLTSEGRAHAASHPAPATSRELQQRIFDLLGDGEGRILRLLIAAYPKMIARENLADAAGYSNPKSGGFSQPVARLIELGFAEAPERGCVKAHSMLFLEGRR